MTEDTPDTTTSEPADAPFDTSLKLTDAQLKRLIEHVNTRLDECCREMGRGMDGMTVGGSWLDRRRTNQLWYEGDLEWRKSDEYLGGVFNESNFSRGDGKRYVRHMAAKITDDLIGTSPFFAVMKKENGHDAPRASLLKAIEDLTQEGVEGSNVPETLREAVELALVRNEAVVKLRSVFEATGYHGPAEVLVDAVGQPVLTPQKGLYIYKNDNLLPVGGKGSISDQSSGGDQSGDPGGTPGGGGMRQDAASTLGTGATGMMALEKDASFVVSQEQAAAFEYQVFNDLPQMQVEREGLDARVLDPRDFICPLKVNDIHDADNAGHGSLHSRFRGRRHTDRSRSLAAATSWRRTNVPGCTRARSSCQG